MRERVGARHWIFLGILSQMPSGTIDLRTLGKLVHSIVPGVHTLPTVEILRSKGLVTYNPETKLVTITEDGATRQRQEGRPDTPTFLRVPESLIRLSR